MTKFADFGRTDENDPTIKIFTIKEHRILYDDPHRWIAMLLKHLKTVMECENSENKTDAILGIVVDVIDLQTRGYVTGDKLKEFIKLWGVSGPSFDKFAPVVGIWPGVWAIKDIDGNTKPSLTSNAKPVPVPVLKIVRV